MKTAQKVIIALLVISIVFAFIELSVISDCDIEERMGFKGCIIGAIMLIVGICLKYFLDKRPVAFTQPNGEHPEALGTIMGIGTNLLGFFHFRELENTWVSYSFFCFILPLFPVGCYRVRKEGSSYGALGTKVEWAIFGSEKGNVLEVATIYLHFYGFLIWLVSLLFGLMMIFL